MHEDGLFREEALRRWREGGTQGQVLRLGTRWTGVAFVVLILATVVAAACLFLIRVPVAVHGPAVVVENNRVLALLPEGHRDEVTRERYLLWKTARTETPLQIERIEPRPVSRQEALALAGGIFAGRPLPETSLLVWATLAPGARDLGFSLHGRGTVFLGEERKRLIDLFWSGDR